MSVPLYLRVLWSYKWLLAVGLIVAAAAGFLAGFTFENGNLVSRVATTYKAQDTVLLGNPKSTLFQAEIPGQTLTEGQTAPQETDLTGTAVIYAYLVSSQQIKDGVQAIMGPLAEDETITAQRRTTQPTGNEAFPGRLSLPVLAVVGTSTDPVRSEQIAQTANQVFQTYVAGQQDAQGIAPEQRVTLTTLNLGVAEEQEGSNPALPIAATGLGVFLAFVALAFVFYNIRVARERAAAARQMPVVRGGSFRRSVERTPEEEAGAIGPATRRGGHSASPELVSGKGPSS